MSLKARNKAASFKKREDPDEIPADIAAGLTPEEFERAKAIVRGCRLSREKNPERAAQWDETIRRSCEVEGP